MANWIEQLGSFLWGGPLLLLVPAVGIYLSVRLSGIQVRRFFPAWRALRRPGAPADPGSGDVSAFAALMTAVGGIVGNGNIAGVATAITAGGPGALFWMWVSGVLGMATMYAETRLGVQFRRKGPDGLLVGGPMYYLSEGLGWRRVGIFFAAAMALKTLFATTTVQSNSMSLAMSSALPVEPHTAALIVAAGTGLCILGGVRSIARTSEVLTPFMGLFYLGAAATALFVFRGTLVQAAELIVQSAFGLEAGLGGAAGITMQSAFRYGFARGVYSNEAGSGSVPIAHASARTKDPGQQAEIAMLGVFLDTMIVATATGLVIVASGIWQGGNLDSTALSAAAFEAALGATGPTVVTAASLLFGLTTLISWAFYGEQCAAYLFGPRVRRPYRALYSLAIAFGAFGSAQVTWAFADVLNAVVMLPNLAALVALAGRSLRSTPES